jgi:hypothetical protein
MALGSRFHLNRSCHVLLEVVGAESKKDKASGHIQGDIPPTGSPAGRKILASLIKASHHEAQEQGQDSVGPNVFRVGSCQGSQPQDREGTIIKEMENLAKMPVDRGEGIRVHDDYPGYHPFDNFETMVEGTQSPRDDHNKQGPEDGWDPIAP